MSVLLARGDLVFEVDEGTPEHARLVANGASPVEPADAEAKPRARRKPADAEGETLGE